jgi:tetratricopeptide (TPR) repeat protein
MSLLLDALQRASKEKEKLAESRGASAAPPEAKTPVEPTAERSPFPSLSIESEGGNSNAAPAVELTMEPIVSEITPIPDVPRSHDPVPAMDAPPAYAEPQLAAIPVEETHFSAPLNRGDGVTDQSSPAVAEITAALAAPMAARPLASNAPASDVGASEVRPNTAGFATEAPIADRVDPVGTPRSASSVNHPSPTLSPQVAREILGATSKRSTNRRAIVLGAAAVLVAGAYLAFFLGAFDRFFGKSGSSLTPATPPPPAVAVVPAPTPEITAPDGEGAKAGGAQSTVQEQPPAREMASQSASKAPRRKAASSPMDQADASESEKPAVRGAGSRQSRQVVVTRAVTSSPLDAAYAAMTAGRLDEAATAYRKALAANPGERDAFLGLAYIAQRKGNNDEARELFLQVLRIDPANSGANSGLLAIAAEGDLPQAASRAREMAERAPDSAVVMGTLGGILAKEGRIAEAQQAYFRAVTLEPENAFHAFNLAVALDRLHKNSQALSFYQRALALAERSTEADRSGFPFKEARQRVEQLSQPANVPLAPSRTDSQAR